MTPAANDVSDSGTPHADAVSTLQGAAGNAMLTVQATNALRALFVRARLL